MGDIEDECLHDRRTQMMPGQVRGSGGERVWGVRGDRRDGLRWNQPKEAGEHGDTSPEHRDPLRCLPNREKTKQNKTRKAPKS